MKTIQIVLTGQAGIGWNFAVMCDGKPLPADDPQDFGTAARALQAALVQLQTAARGTKEGEQ